MAAPVSPLQRRALCGSERSHRALRSTVRSACTNRAARGHRFGAALTGDHPMHPFAIDQQGNLFIDLGSATILARSRTGRSTPRGAILHRARNARRHLALRCEQDRAALLSGRALRHRIRNGEGFAFDVAGGLYVTQHGRDQLSENWPKLYRPEQGPNLPPKSCCDWSKAPTTAGRSAISMGSRRSWCWLRNMVVTAARRSGRARRSKARSRFSRRTGLPTILHSTMGISFRMLIGEVRSSRFTGHGTALHTPRRL